MLLFMVVILFYGFHRQLLQHQEERKHLLPLFSSTSNNEKKWNHRAEQKTIVLNSSHLTQHSRNTFPSRREVPKLELDTIDKWAARLDEEDGAAAAAEKIARHEIVPIPTIPPNKDIHDLVMDLFNLGKVQPEKLLDKLINDNPLGIVKSRQDPFDQNLFKCPSSKQHLISYPDLVDHSRTKAFKSKEKSSWILYQHLRKAGGTGFCELAKTNLERHETPPYFCMVDNRGSLATPPWNSEAKVLQALSSPQRSNRPAYRITSNEWDVFLSGMTDWKGAVLATTFRHPVDRWYSQYRFEHLEHRDGSSHEAPRQSFRKWYQNSFWWTMGRNYYTTTFVGDEVDNHDQDPRKYKDLYWSYHKYQSVPLTYEMFQKALTRIRKFHVLLITEWLNGASGMLEEALGWKVPPKKVLPHQSQANRKASDKEEESKEFDSYVEKVVGSKVYREISVDNVYDILLFHCAKRIYLERLHKCIEQVV